MEITYEFVRERFDYDPEGYLIWKEGVNNQFVGKRAAGPDKKYWMIQFTTPKKKVRAHRLIFLWHHGYLPKPPLTVDHANQNKLDNRIENLREATHQQQRANTKRTTRNTTGLKGVTKANASGKHVAMIGVDGENVYLGCYTTAEEAHAAYVKAAEEIFGEFASGG